MRKLRLHQIQFKKIEIKRYPVRNLDRASGYRLSNIHELILYEHSETLFGGLPEKKTYDVKWLF